MSLLITGVKNALERGENINKIILSFKNAGYSDEEINNAVNEINSWEVQQTSVEEKDTKYKKLPSVVNEINNHPYVLYGLISVLGLMIIVGAALLGLYWDKLFR